MNVRLARPVNRRVSLGTTLRARSRPRHRRLALVALQALVLGILAGLLVAMVVRPGAWSVILFGAGILAYALVSFGFDGA